MLLAFFASWSWTVWFLGLGFTFKFVGDLWLASESTFIVGFCREEGDLLYSEDCLFRIPKANSCLILLISPMLIWILLAISFYTRSSNILSSSMNFKSVSSLVVFTFVLISSCREVFMASSLCVSELISASRLAHLGLKSFLSDPSSLSV